MTGTTPIVSNAVLDAVTQGLLVKRFEQELQTALNQLADARTKFEFALLDLPSEDALEFRVAFSRALAGGDAV